MTVFPVMAPHNIGSGDPSCASCAALTCPDRNANSDYWDSGCNEMDHHANDVFSTFRAPLVAVASGTIVKVGVASPSSGLRVRLRDSCGWEYYYGHMDQAVVSENQTVTAGQLIGYMGRGNGVVHVHFNVSFGDDYCCDIDPFDLLKATSPTACQGSALPNANGGTAVSPTANQVNFFYRDPASGHLLGRVYVNGSGWQAPQDEGSPNGVKLTWDPDAASWGQGHVDLVARDANGHLAVRTYDRSTGWSSWDVHTNTSLSSSPTAVSDLVGNLDVFWLGPNHTLVGMNRNAAGHWTAPARVPRVSNAASGPDAVAWHVGTEHIDIVYRAVNGKLYDVSYDRAKRGWQPPHLVNPTHALPSPAAKVDPGTGTTSNGILSVYYTAVNGKIYHSSYTASATPAKRWSAWYAIPGDYDATSAPDASNENDDHVDVLVGQDGVMTHASWEASNNRWSQWFIVP